jgi:HPt (histidine-containing phosphotransfer) domain-containing protein
MPNALDAEILASLRELNTAEEPTFVKDFMGLFLKTVPVRLEAIRAACDSQNSKVLAQESHALKSSCASVGANQMTALCAELENLGKSQSLQEAPAKLAKLIEEYETTKTEVLQLPELN